MKIATRPVPLACQRSSPLLLLFLIPALLGCQAAPPQTSQARGQSSAPTTGATARAASPVEDEACSSQTLSAAEGRARRQPDDRDVQAAAGEVLRGCFDRSKDLEMARRAADAYLRAAELSLRGGDAQYTREISELLVTLHDPDRLRTTFEGLLSSSAAKDSGERYVMLVDYADGLASLGLEEEAWKRFDEAVSLQPQNNLEAINRYARHLIDRGHPEKAVELIESRLTREQRLRYVRPVHLWREARQRAGMDTGPADEELRLIQSRGRGPAPAPG